MTLVALQRRIVACERCPELRAYCAQVAKEKRRAYAADEYWGRPVPGFGDPNARIVLVGLAPAAHGGNRTGRAFTGDPSGDFLYPALYRAGLSSQAESTWRDDGLRAIDCWITAAAHCAPPENKPTPQELRNCAEYLVEEFRLLHRLRVALALGAIGFRAAVDALRANDFHFERTPKFGHSADYFARKNGRTILLLGSYHPSQRNVNTGLMTRAMMDMVLARATTFARTEA